MGKLLDFFAAGPARIKGLLIGALAIAAAAAALTAWAMLERSWRYQAERDLEKTRGELVAAVDQGKVLAEGVRACNAGVELARRAGEQGKRLGQQLLVEARRLHAGGAQTVQEIEALLSRPAKPGATCDDAWRELEQLHQKVRAP